MKILLIDDDAYWSRGFIQALEWEGWQVTHVTSAQAGLARATEERFDLILLDVMMPPDEAVPEAQEDGHSTGLWLLKRLHARLGPEQVISLLTARVDLHPKEWEGMAKEYIMKTTPTREIVREISELKSRGGRFPSRTREEKRKI